MRRVFARGNKNTVLWTAWIGTTSSVIVFKFTCIGLEYLVIQISLTWVYVQGQLWNANTCRACSICPCFGDAWYWDSRETSCNMSTCPNLVAHLNIPIISWKNPWSSSSSSGVPSSSGTNADTIGVIAFVGSFHRHPALLTESFTICTAAFM